MREQQNRKQNRLKGYDYSQNNAYFITICVKDRYEMLGHVVVGDAALGVPVVKQSEYGEIINALIENIPKVNPSVTVPYYVIMPNHVHLILLVRMVNNRGTPRAASPTKSLVPKIINALKGLSSKKVGFSLWQRSYYDHIIRNDKEYTKIAEYIMNNPVLWKDDRFYPERLSTPCAEK